MTHEYVEEELEVEVKMGMEVEVGMEVLRTQNSCRWFYATMYRIWL